MRCRESRERERERESNVGREIFCVSEKNLKPLHHKNCFVGALKIAAHESG